jgi:hypothetical protein
LEEKLSVKRRFNFLFAGLRRMQKASTAFRQCLLAGRALWKYAAFKGPAILSDYVPCTGK